MLKSANRLSKNKEFDHVFKTGQSFYGKIIGIKAAENGLDTNRIGILISTKVSKKAVVRNRFKRQVRSVIQTELPALKTGKDLVIIVSSLILDKNFQDIQDIIKNGLKRLNLYK